MLRALLKSTLFIGCLLLTACNDASPPPEPDAHAELQKILVDAVGPTVPAAQLYAAGPNGSYRLAAGLRDIATVQPAGLNDRIRAGSMVKTLVATVVLQLVEEGKFGLDAPLPMVLPDAVIAGLRYRADITVRQLLNHTSGLPEFDSPELELAAASDPQRIWSSQGFIDLAAAREQQPPGAHAYSNTNYVLLGLIIEQATGESWRHAIRQRILQPLQLADTRLPEPGDISIAEPYLRGYLPDEAGVLHDISRVDPSMAGAAGGHAMITTTTELARFTRALLRGELFRDPATLASMKAVVPAEPRGEFEYGYGLGLERYRFPDGTEFWGHGGSTAGYAGATLYFPERDLVIVAAHSASDLLEVYFRLALPAYQVLTAPR